MNREETGTRGLLPRPLRKNAKKSDPRRYFDNFSGFVLFANQIVSAHQPASARNNVPA
jgi:hypothetical protein